ncbi:MAG: MoaD/ThiS family protein [Anaerolineales bacterium]|jgi:molybdopterin converting factor small subunit
MNIVLSGNLRRYTSFEGEVELEATTITNALDALVERFPDLKPVLYDADGKTRSVHRLYLNGDVLDVGDIDHDLGPTDELGILTAIAGG